MRKITLRILVALMTLGISITSSSLLHRFRQPKPTPVERPPSPTPSPAPQFVPMSYEDDDAEYPDDRDLSPSDISWFVEKHPRGKLEKLWARLHIKPSDTYSDFSECGYCAARLDYYDFDTEVGDEALLRISDDIRECYRYLVFKRLRDTNDWRLIGHVDEWGKYKDSQSFILVSGGHSWLVTQGQSASGSGVAYYHNRVFAVVRNRLEEVASYECEGYQSDWDTWPTREFTTRILDIQKQQNQTRVKVEFHIEYSLRGDTDVPLFSKRQVAVFVSSDNSGSVLDRTDSTITDRELDHVYKIDSMTEYDFLKYNLSELLNVAKHGTKPQKSWLKDLLKKCDNSAEKLRLLAALAN